MLFRSLIETCSKRARDRDRGDAYDWFAALVGDLRGSASFGVRAHFPQGEGVQMLSHFFILSQCFFNRFLNAVVFRRSTAREG